MTGHKLSVTGHTLSVTGHSILRPVATLCDGHMEWYSIMSQSSVSKCYLKVVSQNGVSYWWLRVVSPQKGVSKLCLNLLSQIGVS